MKAEEEMSRAAESIVENGAGTDQVVPLDAEGIEEPAATRDVSEVQAARVDVPTRRSKGQGKGWSLLRDDANWEAAKVGALHFCIQCRRNIGSGPENAWQHARESPSCRRALTSAMASGLLRASPSHQPGLRDTELFYPGHRRRGWNAHAPVQVAPVRAPRTAASQCAVHVSASHRGVIVPPPPAPSKLLTREALLSLSTAQLTALADALAVHCRACHTCSARALREVASWS